MSFLVKLALLPVALFLLPSPEVLAQRSDGTGRIRVPAPLPHHPGNIIFLGDEWRIPVPEEARVEGAQWRLLDDRLEILDQGTLDAARADPGHRFLIPNQGIGWYRIEFLDPQKNLLAFTTSAVLTPLVEPIPEDSPIGLDAALSWDEEYPVHSEELANLAGLAGMNWIRDRLHWREIETAQGVFATDTKYDLLAAIQSEVGLNILQTFHGTPAWAVEEGERSSRFPADLRHAYRFCRELSKRFRGQVQAWEPWNEANAGNFGGHTTDEMCAFQKACYLGFKAGDAETTVGWNPCGGVNTASIAQGILENETWPYYDTYNIHSYDWPHDYEKLWGPSREAACGRPIWVTECDRGMKASTPLPWGDFSHDNDLRKAEFMAQSYACSLSAGAIRHFHFFLRHYMEQEGTVQFGLLRKDLTPRPGYVALAALGRFLSGAKALGRYPAAADHSNVFVFAFNARPEGVSRDVLVAWAEGPSDWPERGRAVAPNPLPRDLPVEGVFDYLGRPLENRIPEELRSAPVFLFLPSGQAEQLPLEQVPLSEFRLGEPSPLVLQLRMPKENTLQQTEGWTQEHVRSVLPAKETDLRLEVYNFGESPMDGKVILESAPLDWRIEPKEWEVALDPMGRSTLIATSAAPKSGTIPEGELWLKFRGIFGKAERPCLAFRVIVADE